jgi:hypothetical protein
MFVTPVKTTINEIRWIDLILNHMSRGASYEEVPQYFVQMCMGKGLDNLREMRNERYETLCSFFSDGSLDKKYAEWLMNVETDMPIPNGDSLLSLMESSHRAEEFLQQLTCTH